MKYFQRSDRMLLCCDSRGRTLKFNLIIMSFKNTTFGLWDHISLPHSDRFPPQIVKTLLLIMID